MARKKTIPLDLTVKVATALPLSHRLGFPCLACGSPVIPGHVYCPVCQSTVAIDVQAVDSLIFFTGLVFLPTPRDCEEAGYQGMPRAAA